MLSLDLINEQSSAGEVAKVAEAQLNAIGDWTTAREAHLKISNYNSWALNTAGQLGNVLDRFASWDWVYDDMYWRIQEAAQDPTRAGWMPHMFDREADRRKQALQDLTEAARAAHQRWADAPNIAVLDTNMVLDLFGKTGASGDVMAAEFDWHGTLRLYRDSLRLVIPWTVLRELDRHKTGQRKDLSALARAAIRALETLRVDELDRIPLRDFSVGLDQAGRPNRSSHPLSVELLVRRQDRISDDADLELILAASYLQRLSDKPRSVWFVTRDINATVRARSWGVQAHRVRSVPDSER